MQSTSLRGRLSRHLVAAAAVATTAGAASADIVWSGIVNLNIPSTTNGLYLNVLTGAYNVDGGGGSTVAGWDVNPWSAATLSFFNPANPTGGVYVRDASTTVGVSNLGFGTVIGEGSTYSSGGAQTTGAFAFNLNSSENLVGFRLFNEDAGTVHYGWMRIELIDTLNGQPRSVVEYAFESTAGASIAAGVVPAPGVLALLGLAGLAGSRRRRG
jgi:MYXO-CTERM domain-containing protein